MAVQNVHNLKLLYLKKILLEQTDDNHGLSINELVKKLAELGVPVTAQTLRSDIAALRYDNMDIVMDGMGKKTTYHVGQREFSLAEMKMLSDCITSSRSLSQKLSDELIGKIESFFSIYERDLKDRPMFMSGRPKTENEKIYYNVDAIYEAIAANSPIQFFYLEWTPEKKLVRRHEGKIYEVSPWSLIYDDDCYYMVGFDHGMEMIKHYRVDKMERIDVLHQKDRMGEQCFADMDVETYSNRHFGMYGGKSEEVTLQCKDYLINVIMDRFGTEVEIEKSDTEHFRVTVPVVVSKIFYAWVFEFGGDIVIQKPSYIKDEFDEMIRKFVEL